ncbi:MAG: hypothetical protein NVS3B7_00450 [Candidatus Elarobacter sp.]
MRARDERGNVLEGPVDWPFDFAPVSGNAFRLSFGAHEGGESDDWEGVIDRVVYDLSIAGGRIVVVIDALHPAVAEPNHG